MFEEGICFEHGTDYWTCYKLYLPHIDISDFQTRVKDHEYSIIKQYAGEATMNERQSDMLKGYEWLNIFAGKFYLWSKDIADV